LKEGSPWSWTDGSIPHYTNWLSVSANDGDDANTGFMRITRLTGEQRVTNLTQEQDLLFTWRLEVKTANEQAADTLSPIDVSWLIYQDEPQIWTTPRRLYALNRQLQQVTAGGGNADNKQRKNRITLSPFEFSYAVKPVAVKLMMTIGDNWGFEYVDLLQDVPGEYVLKNSGSCASPILSQKECSLAAKAASLANTTVMRTSPGGSTSFPPYCYANGDDLYLQESGANTGKCSATTPCLCHKYKRDRLTPDAFPDGEKAFWMNINKENMPDEMAFALDKRRPWGTGA
jgi:hypothetical protein